MHTTTHVVALLAALGCCVAANASAREQQLKKFDLLAAVRKTVAEQSRGATIRGYSSETEDGQLTYEVAMTVNGHSKDVSMLPDGTVIEIEERVALRTLPNAVRDLLIRKAANGRITEGRVLTKKGALVAYEAQVRTRKKHSEVQVGPPVAGRAPRPLNESAVTRLLAIGPTSKESQNRATRATALGTSR